MPTHDDIALLHRLLGLGRATRHRATRHRATTPRATGPAPAPTPALPLTHVPHHARRRLRTRALQARYWLNRIPQAQP